MANAYHHAISSAKRWGGAPEEYYKIHAWFDDTKEHFCDSRHRAVKHHSMGIAWAEERFGRTLGLDCGRRVPVRWIGEQHVLEDLGRIPTLADWLRNMAPEAWMQRSRKLSEEVNDDDDNLRTGDRDHSRHHTILAARADREGEQDAAVQ